ncbi:TIGR00730 family Rossman fold protein [candidate division KSB1 bacterium]
MRKICVFCGAAPGANKEYIAAARETGRILAREKIGLVYGGGIVGLMGVVAKSVLEHGGEVTGVIPESLMDKEVAFEDLEDLRVVKTLYERKALMAELSDGFIAMPGGIGTIEEYLEVLALAHLGIHQKPCGILNVCGFYDKLIGFLGFVADQKFLDKVNSKMMIVEKEPEILVAKIKNYTAENPGKVDWVLKMNKKLH